MAIGDLELAVLDLDLPDTYDRLTDDPVEIVEGILLVSDATAEVRLGLVTTPTTTESGQTFPAGTRITYDVVAIGGIPSRRLDAMWFREASAGAGATVIFQGTVRRVG